MLPGDLARIAELCTAIGNEVTDESGFVPVRNLLQRFQADLLIRPLLVEGMLASRVTDPNASRPRWMVLVNAETYPYSSRDIEEERLTRQLPQRMRNTIAHELVHSLAFRPSEFGLRLKTRTDTKETLREFIKAVEQETEQLSPLLLWSERSVGIFLQGRKEAVSLFDFLSVLEKVGISRYVLVNRLRLLSASELLFSAGLRNLAIGLGRWTSSTAHLRGWPLFANFDDGLVPSFLLKLPGHDVVPASAIFDDDEFALLGGPKSSIAFDTSAGTKAVPDATKFRVEVTVEDGLRKRNEEFLFVVRRLPTATK
jgi:hypothetical protein